MINIVKGEVFAVHASAVTVMVGGVGLQIQVPSDYQHSLVTGQEVLLHTELIVREDAFTLYGFLDPRQRELFNLLISVSGIGPKTAITILSSTSTGRFLDEILNENIPYLCTLPGIGKKSAQRLIFELKEKISKNYQQQGTSGDNLMEDAVAALMALGYSDASARKVLSGKKAANVEELIKLALKDMI